MNLITVYALVHFLSPVYVYPDGLNVYLAFVRAGLLVFGRKGGFSSPNFCTRLMTRLSCAHFFSFTSCTFQHLGYFLSLGYHPYSICKVSQRIHHVLEIPFYFLTCDVFGGVSKVVRELDFSFPPNLDLRFCSDILNFSFLSLGLPAPSTALSFKRYIVILISCFTVSKGIRNY